MSNQAVILSGQSLVDVAVQHCGSIECLIELAINNRHSVTDILSPGETLELPDVVDKRVVRAIRDGGFIPASDGIRSEIAYEIPLSIVKLEAQYDDGLGEVLYGQSLFDLAVQFAGGLEAAFDLAQLNELSITDLPAAGSEIKLAGFVDADVAKEFREKDWHPATGLDETLEGIDFWGIEYDFIVS